MHWLPLYHLLELPFVWIDPLYRSGLAGAFVSILGALVTVYYVYRLARHCGAAPQRAFAACIALVAAPSFVYVGVVPMHYTLITATSVASIYYLARWLEDRRPQDLLLCALALLAATLTHFETWVLVPLEAAIILADGWRARRGSLQGDLFLWAIVGCSGVVLFFALNVWWTGAPFSFLYGFEGSGNVVASSDTGWRHLADHPRAMWTVAGPVLGLVGIAGGLVCAWRWHDAPARLVALLLFAPVLFFAVQALSTGSIIEPGDNLTDWRNLRYAVTTLPALAFFLAMAPKRTPVAWLLVSLVALVGIQQVVEGRVAAQQDARYDVPFADAIIIRAGDWISAADPGRVLLPLHSSQQDRFELRSGLPSSRFVDDNDTALFREARRHPDRLAGLGMRWIATIGPAGRSDTAPAPTRFIEAGVARECMVFRDPRGRAIVRIWGVGGCR